MAAQSAHGSGSWAGGRAGRTLQLGATEVLDDILPVGRVVELSEVGLQLAAEDLEGGTLADTVGAHETEDVAGARGGETMELEAVGRVAVGDLGLEVGGQVDDGDGIKGALLGADTAPNAQLLRDEGDFRRVGDLDAQLAAPDDGARLFAFLATFLLRGVRC